MLISPSSFQGQYLPPPHYHHSSSSSSSLSSGHEPVYAPHAEVPTAPPQQEQALQRKRPKYTRSKTGCMTCRQKKIKVCMLLPRLHLFVLIPSSVMSQNQRVSDAPIVSAMSVYLLLVTPQFVTSFPPVYMARRNTSSKESSSAKGLSR